ncbi:MAG: AAA family ATPase [Phycisphaerae bacterium]
MRSIAVMNQKGGVGKTTTAVNLSAALLRRGKRVLLIDCDPQAHSTLHVGVSLAPDELSLYDVFVRNAAFAEVARLVDNGLALAPAHINLVGAEIELAAAPERERRLAQALAAYHEHFDFCIIDCAPSLGLLTINSLAAVREVLIPIQPHFLALQGLSKLLETVTLVRAELQPALRVTGIVFCMAETTRLAQEVRGDVARFLADAAPGDAWHGARLFETSVRRNVKLAECPSFGQTVFAYAAGSHGAEDYARLADEVLAMSDDARGIGAPLAEPSHAAASRSEAPQAAAG